MKYSTIFIAALFILLNSSGQNNVFYKTSKKQNVHYATLNDSFAIVYKMGYYKDKAGTGPAVLKTDTLVRISGQDFKGKSYLISKQAGILYLMTENAKKNTLVTEPDMSKVNTELNNAYFLKSYFALSDKLNKEFPLNHYSFRNGYYAWDRITKRNISHHEFIRQTDKEINSVYDSISNKQQLFTNTARFIKENAGRTDYSFLRDSLFKLPVEFCPRSCYFSKSVYQLAKADPKNFYKILEDFPDYKTIIYFAVDEDKELVRRLMQVQGYDKLKKEFSKKK